MPRQIETVLILGSGPNAPVVAEWEKTWFDQMVAINNAWRLRPDWDELIFPEDFPVGRRPERLLPGQSMIQAEAFVPAQNAYGGFVYAGGTMAFTAAYWALHALRPRVLAFMGCDMVYPASGPTHFYGTGTADPLRDDPTLQDLGAKSARLGLLAARQGCACVNLSQDESALLFPRARPQALRDVPEARAPGPAVGRILAQEERLGYFVASGRYWEHADRFDSTRLAMLDAQWRAAWCASNEAVCAA